MVMEISQIVPGLGETHTGPKAGQKCGAIFSMVLGGIHLGLASYDTIALASSDESRVYVKTETGYEFWTPIVWLTFFGYAQALLAGFSVAHRIYRGRETGAMKRNAFVSLIRFLLYFADIGISIWFICQYFRTYESERIRDPILEYYPLLYWSAEIHKWIFFLIVAVIGLFIVIGITACISAKTCVRSSSSESVLDTSSIPNSPVSPAVQQTPTINGKEAAASPLTHQTDPPAIPMSSSTTSPQ